MDYLFAFLTFITLIILLVGLVKPSLVTRMFTTISSRKQILLWFGGATLIFFLLFGYSIPPTDQMAEVKSNEKQNTNIDVDTNLNADATSTPKDETLYDVTSVVDGDTIKVNINGKIETIRLIGINTPETVDPRKPVECFGMEASKKAKELLSGKKVWLEADDTQDNIDKYNRLLRYVTTEEGLFYNLEIIKLGYAYEYTYNVPYKYQQGFKDAEQYAKDNKLGLWADGVCDSFNQTNQETTTTESQNTQEPAPAPSPTPIITTPPPTTQQDKYDCSYNKYNCGDFSTHAEAQAAFEYCGGIGNDIYGLDRDKDGIACETLP